MFLCSFPSLFPLPPSSHLLYLLFFCSSFFIFFILSTFLSRRSNYAFRIWNGSRAIDPAQQVTSRGLSSEENMRGSSSFHGDTSHSSLMICSAQSEAADRPASPLCQLFEQTAGSSAAECMISLLTRAVQRLKFSGIKIISRLRLLTLVAFLCKSLKPTQFGFTLNLSGRYPQPLCRLRTCLQADSFCHE